LRTTRRGLVRFEACVTVRLWDLASETEHKQPSL
jgi:hypothetical protein